MKVTIDLEPAEVDYIHEFNKQRKRHPVRNKIPSIGIFLKIAEKIK